jgi:hypothetical protein
MFLKMGLPTQPVTLSAEQVEELNRKLSMMRHDINNNLSLIVAALELIQMKPEIAARMYATISQQPAKITEELSRFTAEFDKTLGISK